MPQKWTFFTIGVMAGIIAVLGGALLLQARASNAYASSPTTQDNNPAAGIVVATGGSQSNVNDICWVLYKQEKKSGGDSDRGSAADEILNRPALSLACYQVTGNAKGMKLIGVRNVAWDMDLTEYSNERPEVKEIVKVLRDEAAKKKKDNK